MLGPPCIYACVCCRIRIYMSHVILRLLESMMLFVNLMGITFFIDALNSLVFWKWLKHCMTCMTCETWLLQPRLLQTYMPTSVTTLTKTSSSIHALSMYDYTHDKDITICLSRILPQGISRLLAAHKVSLRVDHPRDEDAFGQQQVWHKLVNGTEDQAQQRGLWMYK